MPELDDPWASTPECQNCGAPSGYPYCSADCRLADNPDDTFTPTAADMEFEHDGLLVSSLGGEDSDGELIVVGANLTPERALAAMTAYAATIGSSAGHDGAAELRDRINSRELAIVIVPTLFTRDTDGGWTAHPHLTAPSLAAWLVPPWHPAHTTA